MAKEVYALIFLLFISSTGYGAIIDWQEDTSIDQTSDLNSVLFDNTPYKVSSVEQYQSLNVTEKYTIMLVSIQNGQIEGAISIAEDIASSFPGDAHVGAMKAAKLVRTYDLTAAKAILNKLIAQDKFQRASIELVWALHAMSATNKDAALKHLDAVHKALPGHPYAHNIKGIILTSLEQYEDASHSFQKAINKIPTMISAHINLGFSVLYQSDYLKAINHFDNALSIDSSSCAARYGKAVSLKNLARHEQALNALNNCLSNPNDIKTRAFAAELLLDLKDSKKAWELLTNTAGFSKNPTTKLLATRIALSRGDFDNMLVYSDEDRPQSLYYQGIGHFAKGNTDKAKSIFNNLLKENADLTSVLAAAATISLVESGSVPTKQLSLLQQHKALSPLGWLLEAYSNINQSPEAAIAAFKKSENLIQGVTYEKISDSAITKQLTSPTDQSFIKGIFFHLLGAAPLAQKEFAKNTTHNGFLTSYLQASHAFSMKKTALTIENLKYSLNTAPAFFAANQLMAESLLRTNKPVEALKFYKIALTTKPSPALYLKSGVLAEQLGELKTADELLQQVIKHAPDNYIGYNQLAWFYASNEIKLSEGIELADKANRLLPNNGNVLDTLGWLHHVKGDYDRAAEILTKANQASDQINTSILFHLAQTQQKLGHTQKAIAYAKKALATNPSPSDLAQITSLMNTLQQQ